MPPFAHSFKPLPWLDLTIWNDGSFRLTVSLSTVHERWPQVHIRALWSSPGRSTDEFMVQDVDLPSKYFLNMWSPIIFQENQDDPMGDFHNVREQSWGPSPNDVLL